MGNLAYPSLQKDASMHPRYGQNKNCGPSNSAFNQSAMSHVFPWYLPFPGHRTCENFLACPKNKSVAGWFKW
ncbi:hypothetical protein AMECASPLE_022122 [Ameca splendens]|uniref:Uncharacterized protein n=1 Tax=Ameca splendens TaxID=208324 RepID=A0ABV0Z2X5_9TELE